MTTSYHKFYVLLAVPWEPLHSNTARKHPVPILGPVAGVTCPSFVFSGCLPGSLKHSRRRKVVI